MRLVARSDLPERPFKRRFMLATGYAPIDYVQALRIEEAKDLLLLSRNWSRSPEQGTLRRQRRDASRRAPILAYHGLIDC